MNEESEMSGATKLERSRESSEKSAMKRSEQDIRTEECLPPIEDTEGIGVGYVVHLSEELLLTFSY